MLGWSLIYSCSFPNISFGVQVTLVSERDGNVPKIYVMNPDGTGQTNLTNSRFDDYAPAWRP